MVTLRTAPQIGAYLGSLREGSLKDAAMWSGIALTDVEIFAVVPIMDDDSPLGVRIVAIGDAREVRPTLDDIFGHVYRDKRVTKIVVAHNHPLGCLPTPSESDRILTRQVRAKANSLGIKLLDHMIISEADFFSIEEDRIYPHGCALNVVRFNVQSGNNHTTAVNTASVTKIAPAAKPEPKLPPNKPRELPGTVVYVDLEGRWQRRLKTWFEIRNGL